MTLRIILAWVFALGTLLQGFAQQPLTTKNKRAEKLFYSAVDAYQARNAERALSDASRALDADPGFMEAYILRGDILADEGRYPEAVESYQAAVRTGHDFSPALYNIMANLQMRTGLYNDALGNYRRFLESGPLPDARRKQAERQIKAAEFAMRCVADPVPFVPLNLGDSVNTEYDEYVNAITADDSKLYFTRKDPRDAETVDQGQEFEEDFYVAARRDSAWGLAANLGPPINSHGNEGALCISPDGRYLFFAGCNRDDGIGSCDIYWSKRDGNRWTVPENMGDIVNTQHWDSQPSFSSDGKTLYFASKRPGGKGSSDIWSSTLLPGGDWSVPVNLGDSVNTPAEEMAPFIHPDDQTLYFSSRGHPGLGGYDLFLSRRSVTGAWGGPLNLGYPINTFSDEITLVVNARGDLAYISSDIPGGRGRQDICSFRLHPAARPLLTTYFKGIVYDAETGAKLEADFELTDLASQTVTARSSSDRVSGEFLLVLPNERNYALSVSKENYLFYSDSFFLTGSGSEAKPYVKNIPLKPIRVGETVVLKNIFFDTDKYILKPESMAELARLATLLRENPKLVIGIHGHTDNVGSAAHNMELSKNRARAVYDDLVARGIDSSRLSFDGFGFTRPVDDNTTETGRANNRRTEFKVIGN